MTTTQLLQNGINEKIIRNRYLLLKICCMITVALIFAGFFTGKVSAASGLKIYNYTTKKETNYTGVQAKVTYNGTSIGNDKTPGILVEGVALLPYTDIFANSGIDAKCSYDKSKGTVSISKYNKTLVMTIGSKKATLNGKPVTLPVTPMKIKYVDVDKVKVLVPSRYVSETLGLGYTWYPDKNIVAIVKYSIQLAYNDGDKFEYTGAQGKVTIDGKSVDLGTMPSIITNNTAMLRASKVFSDSKIDADYYYNKSDKTVTLTKNDKKLVMTIGSKTAFLNKKAVKLDAAPLIVTNYETTNSYVMVPGANTASLLGFDYKWNNATRTSVITSKKGTTDNKTEDTNIAPELGDSSVVNETGTILKQWQGSEAIYGKSSGVHELTDSVSASTGFIYSVSRDYNNIKQNSETFLITASSPFSKVSSSNSGNTITIQADNMSCTDQTYQTLGSMSNYIGTISTTNNVGTFGTAIKLELLQDNYQYDIALSPDKQQLYITVYLNVVTQAVIGTNTDGDYITLSGMQPLKATISEQPNYIYLELPYTINSLGDQLSDITGTKYIQKLYTVTYPDKTQFILQMAEGYEYYIMENGNQYTLSFQIPGEAEEPDIPVDIDKSKYEIVIPKPAEITEQMITNEDYYFSNFFVIRMPGNYTEYYNQHTIIQNSKVIDNIYVTRNSSDETVIKIATTKLQGYEIAVDNDNIYIHIGNPKDIYKNIVVLDPGHGGGAPGAQYFGTNEKDMNLRILYTAGKEYFNSDPSKLKVYYIRTTDVDMPLNDRAAFAQKVGADLFVSLHMNALKNSTANGTEVYYSDVNNSPNQAGLKSSKLASYFQTSIVNAIGTSNRGIKQAKYVVLYKNTVPAVLIELGFLSDKNDHAKITDERNQKIVAKTIYDTLLQVFEDYPTER